MPSPRTLDASLLRRPAAAVAVAVLLFAGLARGREAPAADPTNDLPAAPPVETLASSQNLAGVPQDVDGLLELDARIRRVVEKVLPATVGLIVGNAQGSGVIVSADGLVLTAAHVSGPPGQPIQVIMPDGTKYDAVSMGLNREMDDGLVKIEDPKATNLPHVALGRAADLPLGTWTVALGHPGGYQQDRPPVVRVGRLLVDRPEVLISDNTLVGGDSGGPLFDLDGRLIGIHSRIGGGIRNNVHVPVDRFLDDWGLLAASKDPGGQAPKWTRKFGPKATDGMRVDVTDLDTPGARVVDLAADGPADKAGIQLNDRILAMDGRPVQNGQDLVLRRIGLKADEPVTYRVKRGERELEFKVTPVRRFPKNEEGDDDGDDSLPGSLPDEGDRRDLAGFRPFIGLQFGGSAEPVGVEIFDVVDDTAASRAGVLAGDVLLGIDGRLIRTNEELKQAMADHLPGDRIELRLVRGRLTLNLTVDLGGTSRW